MTGIAQIADGNIRELMKELYRRSAKKLYRFGVRMLGNGGLAEERVQESFGRVWRSAGCFDARRGRVGAFLFVISRSAAAGIRNRPSSRSLVPAGDFQLPPLPDGADQILDSLMLREALDKISSHHAEVLRLAPEEHLTQSQIAQRLPATAGKSRRHLTSCPPCQGAEAGFGPLGLMLQHLPPALEPPPDLEARTIAGVLPAAAEDRAGTHVHQIPGAAPAAADTGSPTQAIQIPLVSAEPEAEDGPGGATAKIIRFPRWRGSVLFALAGALAAAIIAAVVVLPAPGGGPAEAAVVIPLRSPTGGPAAGVALARHRPGGWSIELTVKDLPALAPGQFYECWHAGPGDRPGHRELITAGTFTVGRDGGGSFTMWSAANPHQFRTMQITAESPSGGGQHGQAILTGQARL